MPGPTARFKPGKAETRVSAESHPENVSLDEEDGGGTVKQKLRFLQNGNEAVEEMRVKDKQVKVYMTEAERQILQRKARAAGLSVSDFVRLSLIHSDKCEINTIDTEDLRKAVFELNKQGVNLNQFMHWLNTYKQNGFDTERANRVLKKNHKAIKEVRCALLSLQEEARRHKVTITLSEQKGSQNSKKKK